MGRRSQHTPEELRELILGAARRVVMESGFQGLSAREIARNIGYAPGTLYNMFQNLDEILMRVEAGVFDELDQRISQAMSGKMGADAVMRFAAAYVQFAYDNPQLWQLIQEHNPSNRAIAPDWYLERLFAPLARLEPELGKIGASHDPDVIARQARLIWASIHGMIQVSTTPKFGAVPVATAKSMAEALVTQLIAAANSPRISRADPRRAEGEIKRARHAG